MLEGFSSGAVQVLRRLACHLLNIHTPAQPFKTNGVYVYGRCTSCRHILIRSKTAYWLLAHNVDEIYYSEMRDISA